MASGDVVRVDMRGPIPFVYSLENDNGVDEASNERADQEQYQNGADES
jgi:hypothetical protein